MEMKIILMYMIGVPLLIALITLIIYYLIGWAERVPNAQVAARISRGNRWQVRREVLDALRYVRIAAESRRYKTVFRVSDELREEVIRELIRRGFAVAAPDGKSYISIHWNEHEGYI